MKVDFYIRAQDVSAGPKLQDAKAPKEKQDGLERTVHSPSLLTSMPSRESPENCLAWLP